MHATRESTVGAGGPPGRTLGGCERGAVQVEYLVVAVLAAVTLALTLMSLAPGMVGSWWESRSILYGVSP